MYVSYPKELRFSTDANYRVAKFVSYDASATNSTEIEVIFEPSTSETIWHTVPGDGPFQYAIIQSNVTWEYNNNHTYTRRVEFKVASTGRASQNPRSAIRDLIRNRHFPSLRTSRSSLPHSHDDRELRARDTLRQFIGEERWRRFVRDGFITVHSRKDNRTYQLYPGHGMSNLTKVYERGVMIERLCCYLAGDFPPTDHLLMRFLLVLNSPSEFRKLCNRYGPSDRRANPTQSRDLDIVDHFRQLKLRAAS